MPIKFYWISGLTQLAEIIKNNENIENEVYIVYNLCVDTSFLPDLIIIKEGVILCQKI